ncbi:hypothetical protein [Salinirussus salinus]|jgi:hypothetical protein|uniref:hypothetical protein n=1 Tax=Salinirussus salinus TaxID=1198300 RepID=UPI00135CE55D|nr:hypothetical protein [Salinirussus salinus]
MEITRRLLLQGLGAASVVGAGGFAASEVLGPRSWLYDPSARTEAHNMFFLTADVASFLENLPSAYRQQVTGGGSGGMTGSPVSPTEVDEVAMVTGGSFVGDTGLPVGMGTVAMSGGFRTAPFRGLVSSAPSVESAGEVGDYEVYTAETNALQTAGVADVTAGGPGGGDDGSAVATQPAAVEETAIGIKADGGGLVAGSTLASGDLPATAAVEQAIEAKRGNAPLLRDANKYTGNYQSIFGDHTMYMGAVWDPAFVTLMVAGTSLLLENLGGPGGALAELFQRLYEDARAAGAGVNVGPEETETTVVLTYVTPDAARQTGLVQLLDAGFGYAERNQGFGPGIRDVDADYQGPSIVLNVVSDTRTALSGGAGTGGTDGDNPIGGS